MTVFCFGFFVLFLRTRDPEKQCLALLKGDWEARTSTKEEGRPWHPERPTRNFVLGSPASLNAFRQLGQRRAAPARPRPRLDGKDSRRRTVGAGRGRGTAEAGRSRPRPRRAREAKPQTRPPLPAGGRRSPASIVRGRGEDATEGSVARYARPPAALLPQAPRERPAEPCPR